MVDNLSKQQRQYCMKQVKSQDTKPEIIVRKLIHSLGCRYRLHQKNLPGCPDLVFASRKKVVFVNGCYWHRHNCKHGRSMPEARKSYWQNKFNRTVERDKINRVKLKKSGWKVLTVWECQIKKNTLKKRVANFLKM
ncbi:MAG: very short patch repair endonuclease [Planctomycetales bacterium 4572_13]|nr:MAG: very short patch repair endonuclease [Planctomycetales bacterium 4572_13]